MVTSTHLPLQRQTQRGRAAAPLSPGCVAHEGPSLAIHFLRGRMSAHVVSPCRSGSHCARHSRPLVCSLCRWPLRCCYPSLCSSDISMRKSVVPPTSHHLGADENPGGRLDDNAVDTPLLQAPGT